MMFLSHLKSKLRTFGKTSVVQGMDFDWQLERPFHKDRSVIGNLTSVVFVTDFYRKECNILAKTSIPLASYVAYVALMILLMLVVGLESSSNGIGNSAFWFRAASITFFSFLLIAAPFFAVEKIHNERIDRFKNRCLNEV